jgi:hypothetical protein
MLGKRPLNCMRFVVMCLLASAALPSPSQAPLPVFFAITPEESKITFDMYFREVGRRHDIHISRCNDRHLDIKI